MYVRQHKQERPLLWRDRGHLGGCDSCCWRAGWILVLVVHLSWKGVTWVVNADGGVAVEERRGRAQDARCRARARGPLEGEGLLWLSHWAHYGLRSPGGPLCLHVGSSLSTGLSECLASPTVYAVSSGGCDVVGAQQSL